MVLNESSQMLVSDLKNMYKLDTFQPNIGH
jgi:hypothetical protein